jgi:hypothetical protein
MKKIFLIQLYNKLLWLSSMRFLNNLALLSAFVLMALATK